MTTAKKVMDLVNMPDVAEFVEKQLAPFDTSKLDCFRLGKLPKRPWSYRCKYPQRLSKGSRSFKHQYQLSASMNLSISFPHSEEISVGSMAAPTSRGWSYIYEKVEIADAAELLAFAAGACAFRFLRHSRQVPGRNTHPAAHRFGAQWLEEWRHQQQPLPDRRAAIEHTRRKRELRRQAS